MWRERGIGFATPRVISVRYAGLASRALAARGAHDHIARRQMFLAEASRKNGWLAGMEAR
jgi:hypothetical protein